MAKFSLVQTVLASIDRETDPELKKVRAEILNSGCQKLLFQLSDKYQETESKAQERFLKFLKNSLLKHFSEDELDDFDSQVNELFYNIAYHVGQGHDDWEKKVPTFVWKLRLEIFKKRDDNVKERSFYLEKEKTEIDLTPILLVKEIQEKNFRSEAGKGLVLLKTVEDIGMILKADSQAIVFDSFVSLNSAIIKKTVRSKFGNSKDGFISRILRNIKMKAEKDDSTGKDSEIAKDQEIEVVEKGDLIFRCALKAFKKDNDPNEKDNKGIIKEVIKRNCNEFGKIMIITVSRKNTELKENVSGTLKIQFREQKDISPIVTTESIGNGQEREILFDIFDPSPSPLNAYERKVMLKKLSTFVGHFVDTLKENEKKILLHYYVNENSKEGLEKVLGVEKINTNTINRVGKKISEKTVGNDSEMSELISNNWNVFIDILEGILEKNLTSSK